MKQINGDFEYELDILPGWDKRNPDPKKNYGIHGCELRFILRGPKGGISFALSTDWLPLAVQKERMGKHVKGDFPEVLQVVVGTQPMAFDVSYHSPVPTRDWHTDDPEMHAKREKCEVTGGVCYSDGSSLQAEVIRDAMLKKGLDGIWTEMHRHYKEEFDDGGNVNFGDMIAGLSKMLKG